jgi:hypothetical protein
LNGCSQADATDRVLSQVAGGPVQPACTSPTPPITSVVPTVTAPGATTTIVNNSRPNAGAGPIITVSGNNGSLITLAASTPVDRLIVSVNTTAAPGARLSPSVVLDSYYELRFAAPQTAIVLTVQGTGSFNFEFAGSLGGGPLGPYQPAPFIATLNLTGTWIGSLRNDNGRGGPISFQFTQTGNRLSGTVTQEGFPSFPLQGTVNGSAFSYTHVTTLAQCSSVLTTWTGQATTNSMSGTFVTNSVCLGVPATATGTFSATR